MPHFWPPATYIDEDGPPLAFQALAARITTPATRPAPRGAPTHRRQRSYATRWGSVSWHRPAGHLEVTHSPHRTRRGHHEGMGPHKFNHECSWGSHQSDPPPRGPTRLKRPGAPFSSEASNGGPMDGRPTSFKPAVTATLHAPHSRLTARKWVHIWVSHGCTSKRRAPTRSPTRGCRGEKLCRESRWWVAG